MFFNLISMIDEDFLKFYNGAKKIRQQHDSLRSAEKDYVNEGVRKNYVKHATDGIYPAIEQCEEKLNRELEELVKKKDYNAAMMIISCLVGNVKLSDGAKPRERNIEIKDGANKAEADYKSPLPDDLYTCDNFGSLVKNARRYRNECGESGKLTWNRIAERTGISGSYIQIIRKGKIPSEKVISKLAEVFGGDAQKFLEVAKKNS